MKIVIAMMKHETNTFSPIVTNWERYQDWGVYFDKQALEAYQNTGMPMAAYIKLAQEMDADIVTPIAAEAMPSGIVTEDAYEQLTSPIYEAVAKGCDLVMLDLHGAMVSEITDDGEGTLLENIRKINPALPIAVTCDFHCNLTERMVSNCTALIGYKTYPHVDMYEVGLQVAKIVLDSMEGKINPEMAWQQIPLLTHTLKQGTDDEPTRSIINQCNQLEKQQHVLAASFFGGFPLADIPNAGATSIVVTNGDKSLAQESSQSIAELAWQRKEDFVYHCGSLKEQISSAKESDNYPVILLDHEDNCGSGGTQDVMVVIKEIIDQELEGVSVAAVYDPQAVQEMQRAGVGKEITLSLGGKLPMPSVNLKPKPLTLTGVVRVLTDGRWTVFGPMYTGVEVNMGATALFQVGEVKLVVVSLHHEPWDIGVFTSVGIQPQYEKYLLLKSRIHYRAGFAAIGNKTIHCDGEGVTTSRNELLNYKNLRRPIFPLDEGVTYI